MILKRMEICANVIISPSIRRRLHMRRASDPTHRARIQISKGSFKHDVHQFSSAGFAGSGDPGQKMADVIGLQLIHGRFPDGWQDITVDQIAVRFNRAGAKLCGTESEPVGKIAIGIHVNHLLSIIQDRSDKRMTYFEQEFGSYSTYHEDFVTQNQKREPEQASNSVTGDYSVLSSTTTGARACARTRESHAQMLYGQYKDVCLYYADSFRRSITPIIQKQIAELIRGGMTGEVIRMAIDETQMAPRPSWAYCAAILRRCEDSGIKTIEDWNADKQRYSSRLNPAMNYQQRKYTDDDYGPDFFIDLS